MKPSPMVLAGAVGEEGVNEESNDSLPLHNERP
jgi:hypothetical protein